MLLEQSFSPILSLEFLLVFFIHSLIHMLVFAWKLSKAEELQNQNNIYIN